MSTPTTQPTNLLHQLGIAIAIAVLLLVAVVVGTSTADAATPTPKPSTKAVASPSPSASPSSEPTATSSSTTTQKLKERIERIVEEKSDKIKGMLSQLDVEKRGFIAQVQRVSENTVTVKSSKDTEIITVAADTQILKKGKVIPVTDIAVDNWVLALGTVEDDTFSLKKLLVSDTSLRPATRLVHIGTIQNITAQKIDFQPRGDAAEVLTIKLTKTTQYQDLNGNDITLKDITSDTQALVVGSEDETGKTAHLIRILAVIEAKKK
jgi:hypothetical protein